jgi:hypothetical protein
MTVKLNIGSGDTKIEGFTPIDAKLGHDARDLHDYETSSVSEIRASHILEHFTFRDASAALAEWVRVLEPGGRLRIAVPDVDKCLKNKDPKRLFWLMGGQTDSDDIHRSAYDAGRLHAVMAQAGLVSVQTWTSDNTDTASHPVSLNLEGFKSLGERIPHAERSGRVDIPQTGEIKINAYMSLPRYEAAGPRAIIEGSLRKNGINLVTSQGVFWGQCMQRMFELAVNDGLDWIITTDFDSLFNADDVATLLHEFGTNPQCHALAALQCRRGKRFPLMTTGDTEMTLSTLDPIKCETAHFGMTLFRVSDLKDVAKPWFKSQPDENGEYGDNRLDDDIWFWQQWREAGKSVFVTPRIRIGHMEEMVAVYDENLEPHHEYITEWRENNLTMRQSVS